MTNAQHTPGPWKAITYLTAVTTAWDVVDAQGQSVLSSDDDKANARLIAAAPETAAERDKLKALNAELLEALVEVEQMIHANEMNEGTMAIVREAIAKATGS